MQSTYATHADAYHSWLVHARGIVEYLLDGSRNVDSTGIFAQSHQEEVCLRCQALLAVACLAASGNGRRMGAVRADVGVGSQRSDLIRGIRCIFTVIAGEKHSLHDACRAFVIAEGSMVEVDALIDDTQHHSRAGIGLGQRGCSSLRGIGDLIGLRSLT